MSGVEVQPRKRLSSVVVKLRSRGRGRGSDGSFAAGKCPARGHAVGSPPPKTHHCALALESRILAKGRKRARGERKEGWGESAIA